MYSFVKNCVNLINFMKRFNKFEYNLDTFVKTTT